MSITGKQEWHFDHTLIKFSIETAFIMETSVSNSKNRQIYEKWLEIHEIISGAYKWPFRIIKLFWTQNIKNFDRLLVAAFVYVNGLNPVIFLEWAHLNSMCRDYTGYKHFTNLFDYLIRENINSMCITLGTTDTNI